MGSVLGNCAHVSLRELNYVQISFLINNCARTHTHSCTYTVCPFLTLGNGTVRYSMEMGVERNVGSVATHTCISGYRLLMQDGGNTRTCNISGWSGQDFICGKWCEYINCIWIVFLSFNFIMVTALWINMSPVTTAAKAWYFGYWVIIPYPPKNKPPPLFDPQVLA